MGREITLRHAGLFQKKGKKNIHKFIYDIFNYGKFSELLSFAVWEVLHRFGLFPKKKYLKFYDREPLSLNNENLSELYFTRKIERLFKIKNLKIEVSHHNWKLLFIKNGEMYGCLYPDDTKLYKSIDHDKSLIFIKKFPERIKSVFISSQNTIFVCVKGAVYVSSDHGSSFKKTLEMGSSESWFRHNNEMTETKDKTLVIGEYGNVWENNGWRQLAYLYYSSDNGESWETSDFLIKKGTNKHVHLVKYSKLLDKLFVADGDNKKKLWISNSLNSSDSKKPKWKAVNKIHMQMGGYTSVVENTEKILFGTDYQGGTNFLVETKDGVHYDKKIVPDPYRRSPINNMVQRNSKEGNEIWAILPFSTSNSKCLLMFSSDGGKIWNKVIEYDRITHKVWLASSSNDLVDELYFSIEDLKNSDRIVYRIADR